MVEQAVKNMRAIIRAGAAGFLPHPTLSQRERGMLHDRNSERTIWIHSTGISITSTSFEAFARWSTSKVTNGILKVDATAI